MFKCRWNCRLLLLFLIACAGTIPPPACADILHDDFNDSSANNKWSGGTGSFTGNGGTISYNRVSTDTVEGSRALELQFNVTAGSAYSGYYSALNDTNVFIDTPTNRAISFFVKGLAGNEVFKIEVGESSGLTQKTLVRDFINGGVTTSWRQVNIPMMSYDALNFTDPRWSGNFAIVFEEGLGAPRTGAVRIDSIVLVKDPDTYLVDSYDDADTTKSSFGGSNVFFENNADLNAQRDTTTYYGDTGASLRMYYKLSDVGAGNYVVYEQSVNNGLGKGQDIRMMTSLHFRAKSDSGMRGNLVNVWMLDMGSGSMQKDLENYIPRVPSDTWVPVNIPLSAYSSVDTASAKMIKWAWEYEDKSGTMWIDAVEFSRGYDRTAPSAPTLSYPAADSVLQETAPAFSWSSVSDAQGVTYFLQVTAYEDTDFWDPILSTVTTSTGKTFTQTLNSGGRYRWRVAAFDGHGNWSQFSDSRAFKIQDAILENFNDSVTYNKNGGASGSFAGGSGSAAFNRTSADAAEGNRSAEIVYSVTGSGNFAGFYSELNNLNVTDTRQFRALSFFVKGLAGNEVFDIELGESSAKTQQISVRNFVNGGVPKAWREIQIPLLAFDQLSFTNPWWNRNFATVMEYDQGLPRSGTVRVDHIRLLSDPDTYMVDTYDDADTSKGSLNGTNYFFGNSSGILRASLDSSTPAGDTGASLRINYDVTNTGGGSYAVFEQNLTNTLGKGQDIRTMTSLRFWTKADSGYTGPLPNVWLLDLANNNSLRDLENHIAAFPETWAPVNIPLRHFPTPDSTSAKMIKWAWEYEDKTGTMWLDAVEFSRGYDATAPNTPVLSGVTPDSTPTFTWTGGSDAQGESYFIQVTHASDTAFARVIFRGLSTSRSATFATPLAIGQRYQWRVAAFDGHGNWTGFSDTKSFVVFEDTGRSTVFVSNRGDSSNVGVGDTDGAFGGILEAVSFLDPSNGADTVVVFNAIGADSYRLSAAIAPDSGMTLIGFREWNRIVNGQNTDTGGGTDTYAKIANSANTATIAIANVDNVKVIGLILDGDSAGGSAKDGVYLNNSSYDSISVVHVYRMNAGMRLSGSETNMVAANIVSRCLNEGIVLASSSQNNMLSGNTLGGNDSAGISLQSASTNNTLRENIVSGGNNGFHIAAADNVVTGNAVTRNTGFGVQLDGATHAKLLGNRIANNGGYGVFIVNSAQGNYAALNEIDSNFPAGVFFSATGTNHTDTFEANLITRCETASLNAEGASFDLRYNWWNTRDEDAVNDSAVNTGGSNLLVQPFSLNMIDTSAAADTVSPDSTKIRADSSVTVSSVTIKWDTVTVDRDGTALGGLSGFHVYRTTSPTSDWHSMMRDTVMVGGGTDTRYVDTSVSAGSTYYYRVTAFDSHYTNGQIFLNESWFSDTRIVSVPPDTSNESLAIKITAPVAGDTLSLLRDIRFYVVKGPANYDTVMTAEYSPDSGTTWSSLYQKSGDTQNLYADSDGETYTLRWGVHANLTDTLISGRVLIRLTVTSGSDTRTDTVSQLNVQTQLDTGSTTLFVSNRGDSSGPYVGDTDGAISNVLHAISLLSPSNGPDTLVVFNAIGTDSYRLTISVVPDTGMTILGFREWNRIVNGQNTDTGGGTDTYAKIANSANTAVVHIPNVDHVRIAGLILDGDSAAGTSKSGVYLENSSSDSITLVHVYRMNTGIRLNASETNQVAGNIIGQTLNEGIRLISSSQNNVIRGNTLTSNDSAGISAEGGSSGNRIEENMIRKGEMGIHVAADNNGLTANSVLEMRGAGIRVNGGLHNRISRNWVSNNAAYGVFLVNGAQGNTAAQNDIDSAMLAGIFVSATGTNHTDTFEANNVTRCDTGALNAEGTAFDMRYNWWGGTDEDAVNDTAVNTGGSSLTVTPFRLTMADTTAGADTVSPDSTRIKADSSVTTSSVTITWDTVTADRDSTTLDGLWGFHVFRVTAATANWYGAMIDTVKAGGGSDTKYADTGVTAGNTYYYRVTAFDSHYTNSQLFLNESWFSDTRAVSVPAPGGSTVDSNALVFEDFNDSSTKNKWGGTTGTFTGGSGSIIINRVSTDAVGDTRSLELKYAVTSAGTYSGYYSPLNDTNIFTDTPNRRALSFYVKGLAGGEIFKIEVGESSTLNQKVTIRDFLNGGVRTGWREVHIPMFAYDSLNFTDSRWNGNFAVTFEESYGHPKSGTVRIDNVRITRDPDTYLIDTYDDPDTAKGSFGGTNYFYGNNGGIVAPVRDDRTYVGDSGASLRIYYKVANTSGDVYSVFEQTLNNTVNKGQDVRMMSSLHFWVRGDTGQTGPLPNLWFLDMGNNNTLRDLENHIPALIPDTWVPVNIPLRHFTSPDTASAKMLKWAWEYEDKSGTMWIDAVELSKGYDATAPNTPTLSSPTSNSNVALSTLTLAWTGSSDAQGESYYVQVTGFSDTAFTKVVQHRLVSSATTRLPKTLASGQKYQWRVAAVDGHGNWTGFSDTRSFTVISDTNSPPTLNITSPDAVTISGTTAITVSGTVSDTEDTPVQVTFQVNGASVSDTAAVTAATGAWSDSLILSGAGQYTITAIATDSNGNAASASVLVTVDLAAPIVKFASRLPADTQSSLTLTGSVLDSKAVTDLRVTQNSDTVTTVTLGSDSKSFSFSVTVSLARGKNQFVVKATNVIGGIGFDTLNITRTSEMKTASGGTRITFSQDTKNDTWVGFVYFSDTASTPIDVPVYNSELGSYGDQWTMTIQPKDSGTSLQIQRPPDTMDLKLGESHLKRSNLSYTVFEFKLLDTTGDQNIGGATGSFTALTLSLKPSATSLNGVSATDLKVFTLNEQAGAWEQIGSSGYDAVTGEIKGTLSHLSFYAIFADTSKATLAHLSDVIVYPNPFVPNDGINENGRWAVAGDFTTGIVVDNLTDDVNVTVFTISGKKVFEQRVQNAGRFQWDAGNKVGDKLASGIYVLVVKDMKGRGTAIRKIAIVK